MLNSFITSFKLKNAYKANAIIYSLKHTPLIKKMLPYSLYTNKGLKIFANIVSAILEVISLFIGKIIYLLFFYLLFLTNFKDQSLFFINGIVFLTIIGGIYNTNIFNPSVDKYYAIFLMNFNAKKYILANYLYFLLSCFIGFLPFTIIFGLSVELNILTCILIPIYIVCIKNIANALMLNQYKKKKKIYNENRFTSYITIIAIFLLGLAYILPYFNYGINENIFYIVLLITFIIGISSFIYILKYDEYEVMAKELLKKDELVKVQNTNTYSNIINKDIKESKLEGYAYLNDIFVKRHRKLLMKATKNISVGSIFIFVIISIILLIFKDKNTEINNLLKHSLSYFLLIMYYINRGQRICQTMFMNCDHSMLTYRFYRKPKAILSLFKERLKTLIKLNIIPGIIIATGTTILLYVTGGATTLEYIITFTSITFMSVFFSIHYLVLYYLLQPFNVNLEMKNPIFTIICGVTYMACYIISQSSISILLFGICMCSFTVFYSFIALFLAYKYASNTFKLRI